jgi:hypothetical protein
MSSKVLCNNYVVSTAYLERDLWITDRRISEIES